MRFLKAYLTGIREIGLQKNDIERLKLLPQRIENGIIYRFDNKEWINTENPDLNITLIEADRINNCKRYTEALQREVDSGFNKLLDALSGDVTPTTKELTLDEKILNLVEAGDKKGFKALRKEIKDAWFALPDDVVSESIIDLAAAVATKDLNEAEAILADLETVDDVVAEEEVEVDEETPPLEHDDNPTVDDVVAEIIEDIKSCIDDEDEEEFKELLEELKEHDTKQYEKWKDAFTTQSEDGTDEDEYINVILDDLDDALEDKDTSKCHTLIAALAELVEEDDEDLVEYTEKVAALTPKKRSRRGRK
jgi:hypothetical protein